MNNKLATKHLVGLAVLTAIVIVLQFLGSFIRFGVFSISLVLIPIVVGAALYGPLAGAWLGLAFGVAVLLSGDAAAFLAINVPGTLITVLVKGALAGLCAGAVYYVLADQASRQPGAKHNNYPAVIAAAIVCPVVNTGIFLLGCKLFFMDTINAWAEGAGFASAGKFMIFGLVGGNFLFELLFNIILSPLILRIIAIGKKETRS